jgi:hypothetical protein
MAIELKINVERKSWDLSGLEKLKGLRIAVNDYIFKRMSQTSKSKLVKEIVDYIYSRVKYRSGRLGRAVVPLFTKVNQYSSNFGVGFDNKLVPYLDTQIGHGWKLIGPPKGHPFLTIPKKGSPSYTVYPRKSFPRYGKGTGEYKDRRDNWSFKSVVRVRRRVFPEVIQDRMESLVQRRVLEFTQIAIDRFVKEAE